MTDEMAEKIVKMLQPWAEAIEERLKDAPLWQAGFLETEFKNETLKQQIKEMLGVEIKTIGDLYEVYIAAKISLEEPYIAARLIQNSKGVFKEIYMQYDKFESYVFELFQGLDEKKKDILRKALGDKVNDAKVLFEAMKELEKSA